eukprot:CAMPEP_0197457822 /NCGR_PEP_ID=MMETSP1175-20131217/47134_1 /TAXON_ID=1003142 /ORGANISM="Triceratium dubium, Strain CCMP147" /LENGTH=271 /DNA_ID=CAMNT_0042992283 /DNA_START=227 /DNA_END=1042 /DNA_ORIENTATION=+
MELELPNGCEFVFAVDPKTIIAFESGRGWWAWGLDESPVTRQVIVIDAEKKREIRKIPLLIPAEDMKEGEPLFMFPASENKSIALYSLKKCFLFEIRQTKAGDFILEYAGCKASPRTLSSKSELSGCLPRSGYETDRFGFTFEMKYLHDERVCLSTLAKMEVRKDDQVHFSYSLYRLHINHFPYAWDGRLMLCGDSRGEDAVYSLQLLDWQTGEKLRGDLGIPTRKGFIETDWKSAWLNGTLFYVQCGSDYASAEDTRAPCTLIALEVGKK